MIIWTRPWNSARFADNVAVELKTLGRHRERRVMPLLFIGVPRENRGDLLTALRQLELADAEVVENAAEPGDLALRMDDSMEPAVAAERVGQILSAANEFAGRQLGAIATGEAGWGDPPRVI